MPRMKNMSAEMENTGSGSPQSPSPVVTFPAKRLRATPSPFGRPTEFLGNRFVYAVISQRAHGLSIGVNLNPDKGCNFDCPYCEVNRNLTARDSTVDLDALAGELQNLLALTHEGRLGE